MKTPSILTLVMLFAVTAFAQQPPAPMPPRPPEPAMLPPQPIRPGQAASAGPKDTANYLITVKWNDSKAGTNSLKVLTAEGSFSLDAIQSSVRIDESEIPTTVSFNGTVTPVTPDKARLKVFLGRTVPYVTSTYSGGQGKSSSSYQQMRVGISSEFTVTYGKPLVIQADQNGEVSVLVRREEN